MLRKTAIFCLGIFVSTQAAENQHLEALYKDMYFTDSQRGSI